MPGKTAVSWLQATTCVFSAIFCILRLQFRRISQNLPSIKGKRRSRTFGWPKTGRIEIFSENKQYRKRQRKSWRTSEFVSDFFPKVRMWSLNCGPKPVVSFLSMDGIKGHVFNHFSHFVKIWSHLIIQLKLMAINLKTDSWPANMGVSDFPGSSSKIQVIQRSLNLGKGHLTTSQKGHQQNCQVWFFF